MIRIYSIVLCKRELWLIERTVQYTTQILLLRLPLAATKLENSNKNPLEFLGTRYISRSSPAFDLKGGGGIVKRSCQLVAFVHPCYLHAKKPKVNDVFYDYLSSNVVHHAGLFRQRFF